MSPVRGLNPETNYIPMNKCVDRMVYRVSARNICIAVYNEKDKGFTGIREKFGNRYLDTEYHADLDCHCATVFPKEELGLLPVYIEITEFLKSYKGQAWVPNRQLFQWLDDLTKQAPLS